MSSRGDELDQKDWVDDGLLTDAEKAIIEARFRDMEANPQASIDWAEARQHLAGIADTT